MYTFFLKYSAQVLCDLISDTAYFIFPLFIKITSELCPSEVILETPDSLSHPGL